MKVYLLVAYFFVFGETAPEILYREISPGIYVSENLTDETILPTVTVDTDDVKVYFRNQNNRENDNPLDLTNATEVNELGFSKDKETVFIIHGWHNEYDSSMCLKISNAIFSIRDDNVFVVDWSKIAKGFYVLARHAVPDVAEIVSKLIQDLVANNGLNLDKTFIVGHSLGAHIAGITGNKLSGKLNHIVGLDPALPLFNWSDEEGRLDPTDAKFVQVIHTCAGLLGFDRDIGHVDYWPNGGSGQPGCILDITGACSHGRSYKYFAESIVSSGFLSHKCDSYDDYKDGKCTSIATSLMGEYNPDTNATGSYYLETNKQSPFAKN